MIAFNISELKNNQHIRQKKKLYYFGPCNMGLRQAQDIYLGKLKNRNALQEGKMVVAKPDTFFAAIITQKN